MKRLEPAGSCATLKARPRAWPNQHQLENGHPHLGKVLTSCICTGELSSPQAMHQDTYMIKNFLATTHGIYFLFDGMM